MSESREYPVPELVTAPSVIEEDVLAAAPVPELQAPAGERKRFAFPWKKKFLRAMGIGLVLTVLSFDAQPASSQDLSQPDALTQPATPVASETDLSIENASEIEVFEPGRNTTFIDFIPGSDMQQLIRRALSIPEDQALLVTEPGQPIEMERFKTDLEYAAQYALTNYLASFGEHGVMTTTSFREFSSYWSGQQPEQPQIESLYDTVKILETIRLSDGSLRIRLSVDPEVFGQKVANAETTVVNASTIVGEFWIEYQVTGEPAPLEYTTHYHPQTDEPHYLLSGHPLLKDVSYYEMLDAEGRFIVRTNSGTPVDVPLLTQAELNALRADHEQNAVRPQLESPRLIVYEPYTQELGELAYQNMMNLLQVAWDNPNKIIVTAAGNHNNYFYELREQIEAELSAQGKSWPQNLVIVALQRLQDYGGYAADGQDIIVPYSYRPDFVDTNKIIMGSSEATDVVSSIVDYLIAHGHTPQTFRSVLLGDSENGNYGLTEWDIYNKHSPAPREGAYLLPVGTVAQQLSLME